MRTVQQNTFVEELNLSYFHPVTGFPLDFLYDFFEGLILMELCLCLKDLIKKGIITFDGLNSRIKSFPYRFSGKVRELQQITKANFATGRIRGNGNKNRISRHKKQAQFQKKSPHGKYRWTLVQIALYPC